MPTWPTRSPSPGTFPHFFIFGMAPSSGMLSPVERRVVLDAIERGMNIVNGLHEFLNDDPEFAAAATAHSVTILDVRRPRDKKNLRMFSGHISTVTCPRIAVLGTDGAIGKRTTATILTRALNERGIKAVMVGTGQTGLIQGARYGVALDAIPCQFCSGEMEATVVEAFEGEHPDVIIIEGQGALSHPAYLSSSFILRGSRPHAVILQHAPARRWLGDFADVPMPTAASEINLIETFADTKVIGLTINHEQHDRRRGHRGDQALRVRARHPGHRRAHAIARPAGRHGAAGVPRARQVAGKGSRRSTRLREARGSRAGPSREVAGAVASTHRPALIRYAP